MPITAKLNIPSEIKDISFGRTLINWDNQGAAVSTEGYKNSCYFHIKRSI